MSEKAPYDVLIVGGGPAGAAAAVYAARKGIRVGIAAERFGGQLNDTMSIENYISVLETDGPKFAAALEAQVESGGFPPRRAGGLPYGFLLDLPGPEVGVVVFVGERFHER